MTERDYYKVLKQITADGHGKLDSYVMMMFEAFEEKGVDVNTVAVSMLAQIREDAIERVRRHATIYGRIGDIVSLSATPAQILELLDMPEVKSLEASRMVGPIDET